MLELINKYSGNVISKKESIFFRNSIRTSSLRRCNWFYGTQLKRKYTQISSLSKSLFYDVLFYLASKPDNLQICFIDPSSAVTAERKQCTEDVVIVNPYVSRALFAAGRGPTSDPLPRKPIQNGNTPTQEPTGNLNVTDGQDMSIVLKNPRVRESSVGSSSVLRSDVDNLTTPREDEEKVVKLRYPHSRETDEGKTKQINNSCQSRKANI